MCIYNSWMSLLKETMYNKERKQLWTEPGEVQHFKEQESEKELVHKRSEPERTRDNDL